MTFLLIKLCGRNFVVKKDNNNQYSNFIVQEFHLNYSEGETFSIDKNNAKIVDNNSISNTECSLKVIKLLKKHITTFEKKRRKRHKKLTGYTQIIAYLKVIL